jgi:hypothetical protein
MASHISVTRVDGAVEVLGCLRQFGGRRQSRHGREFPVSGAQCSEFINDRVSLGSSHADCKEGRNERIERTRQTVVTNGLDQDCFGSAANQAPPVCQVWSRRPNRCAVRR